jgi:tetratricopeptide (TPR) repeat protein
MVRIYPNNLTWMNADSMRWLRYLHEIGDYEVSQRVVNTAMNSCDDKTSLLYAQLLSITGSRFYDLNRLTECRDMWTAALKIRKDRLDHDDPLIAAILHNLGNLETASGNLEESRDAFDRATLIWKEGGDETASELALTYLCLGRLHMLRGALGKAEDMVRLSEGIFVRKLGKDKGVMAHVHLGYGNIHYYKKHWDLAFRSYKQCYEIAVAETPIHPITASAYYSMGCVEFELKHLDVAR